FDHLVINTNLNLPTNTVPDSAADHPVVWQHFLGPAADWGRALAYEIKLFSPVKHDGGTILWMEVSDSTVADVQDTFDIPIAIDFDCTIDTVKYLFKEMNDGYITEVRLYGPDLSDGTNIADSQYWVDITDRTGDTWTTITCARDPGSAISASAGDRYALRFYTNFSASQDDSLCCGWAKMRVTR
ncbi:MAG: hypothetical protein U9M89_02005, partial [Patescibacteria group bacterium]|nr:hypothetical protein [Patescibacteria group bacterium]